MTKTIKVTRQAKVHAMGKALKRSALTGRFVISDGQRRAIVQQVRPVTTK